MPHFPRTCCCILLFVVYHHPGFAQGRRPLPAVGSIDSLGRVRLGFERVLNTFTGTGDVSAAGAADAFRYEVRQQVRSRLVRVQGSPRQDEYQGSVHIVAPLAEALALSVREESSVLGGSRGAGIEAIAQHRLLAGPDYRPVPNLGLRGAAGWEWNSQRDRTDGGLALMAGLDVDEVDVQGLSVNGSASWLRSDLGDRDPEDADARVRLLSTFQPGTGDSLEITYQRQVRELYSGTGTVAIPAATAILRRSEEVLNIRNALWFLSGDGVGGGIEGGLTQRGIDRAFRQVGTNSGASFPLPNTIDQLMIDVIGRIRWEPLDAVYTRFGAGFASGEETHDIRSADDVPEFDVDAQRAQARRRSNKYERIHSSMAIETFLLEDGMIRFEGTASLLRYDTPDSLNTDDRDEQRFTAGLHVSYALGPGLQVSASFEGGQNHLVYLSRFQSANNVRIRTLRFAPSVVWGSQGRFRNALHAEIAASYTVYDYEDLISSVQSFSYRQAAWTDSLTVSVGTRMGLEFFGSLRLFERGILRWSEFTERPQRAFLELYLWPRITYLLWDNVALGIGFRSFRQERYVYDKSARTYDGAVGSFGPTVSVSATIGSFARLSMTGWRETQHLNSTRTRSLSNLSLSVETRL